MPLASLESPPISKDHNKPSSSSSSSSSSSYSSVCAMSQPGPSSLSKLRDLTLGSAGEHLKQEMAVDMPMMCEDGDEDSSQFSMSPREHFDHESELCMRYFESWTQTRQTEFVEQLVARMSFHQHEHIYSILMPMLQRDFITALPGQSFFFAKGRRRDRRGRGPTPLFYFSCFPPVQPSFFISIFYPH